MRLNLKKTLAILAVGLVMPFFAQAQNIRVTGTVTDQSGETVIGAGIMVQNTQNGTVSGADGTYSITVPSGAILEISSIGY